MRKVTIEDISRDTGLSRGTVSRALNDRPDISKQTRQKVLEVCRKLNYVPSHAARSLATGRNYAVAVLVDEVHSAYSAGFIRGITGSVRELHYAVHVIESGANPSDEQFDMLSPERIDAALNAVPMDAAAAARLRASLADRLLASTWDLEGVACDVFAPDYREAGRMTGRFFIRNGAREILYVHCPTDIGAAERLSGFHEICREHGLDIDAATAIIENINEIDALDSRFERAEAVAAANDHIAISIMMRCLSLGRKPGENLAVMGFGNEAASCLIRPDLTTIDVDSMEIGRRAMQSVIQRLNQEHTGASERTSVAPRLIRRSTTRQYASG